MIEQRIPLIAFILILTSPFASATPRPWRSQDGSRSIIGEFVSRDATNVRILRQSDTKNIDIPLTELFSEDLAWLNANHPLPGKELPPNNAIYDTICFGDTRHVVMEKLKKSPLLESTLSETLMGRTGLNGFYQTRGKIGGANASLSFAWDEADRLKELTLEYSALSASTLAEGLTASACWNGNLNFLSMLYGKPQVADAKLNTAKIPEGSVVFSHRWLLPQKGSALLGASHSEQGIHVTVRFTTKIY